MAQQLPVYSQYSFNAFLLNPAAAGAEGYTSVNSTSRQQWLGVEGAPVTYSLSLQSRIMKRNFVSSGSSVKKRYQAPRSGRVGLGAYIYKDRIGLLDQTGTEFTYAYHLAGTKSQLSLGVTFSFFQFKLNKEGLRLPNATDKLINNEPMIMYIPDANVGVYYTNQSLFFGFSVYHLSKASIMFGPYKDKNFRLQRQYNTTAGFIYHINDLLVLEPSCYIKVSEQWRLQGDITAKLIYDSKMWFGVGYRNPQIAVATIGFKVNRFYLGYGFDYSSNPLSIYSSGTHELMLAIKLGDNVRRYRWMERY
jgi:type IX secretion system PorP/SprF family membrane protein